MSEKKDNTFEFFKHLTTMNLAVIGFLVVMADKSALLSDADKTVLLGDRVLAFRAVIFPFGVSLVGTLLMMLVTMRPIVVEICFHGLTKVLSTATASPIEEQRWTLTPEQNTTLNQCLIYLLGFVTIGFFLYGIYALALGVGIVKVKYL